MMFLSRMKLKAGLLKDDSKLMLLAFMITIPIAYYYDQCWLNAFEFGAQIGWPAFFLVVHYMATFRRIDR